MADSKILSPANLAVIVVEPLSIRIISPPEDMLATEGFDDEYVTLTPEGLSKVGNELLPFIAAE